VMLYEMLTHEAPFFGENVNAIMYQTLNAVPKAPGLLNAGVPEMLNFIVAKALAKERDDRYQNAKDFAADLRACREVIPRSNQTIDTTSVGVKKKPLDTIVSTGRNGVESGAEDAVTTLGLSNAFDSNEATMRLASMTADVHEVDELAKTLKMAIPGVKSSKQGLGAKQKTSKGGARPAPQVRARSTPPTEGSNFKVVILILVVLALMLVIYVY